MNSWQIGRSHRETWRYWMVSPVLAGLDWLLSLLFGANTAVFLMTTLMWRLGVIAHLASQVGIGDEARG
jgi:hypothetical protein